MSSVLNFLDGKKTYIVGFVLSLVLAGLVYFGVIDEKTYEIAFTVLVGLGLSMLRMGVASEVKKLTPEKPTVTG